MKLKITYANGDVRKIDCMAIEYRDNILNIALRLIASDGERIYLNNVKEISTIFEESIKK